MFEIIKTSCSEVSFIDGIVEQVFLCSTVAGIISVDVESTGKYSFKVIEDNEHLQEALEYAFRKPYFQVDGNHVVVLPEGLKKIKGNMETKDRLRKQMDNNESESCLFSCDDTGAKVVVNMHTSTLAQIIVGLMNKDNLLCSAIQSVLITDNKDSLENMAEELLLLATAPTDRMN